MPGGGVGQTWLSPNIFFILACSWELARLGIHSFVPKGLVSHEQLSYGSLDIASSLQRFHTQATWSKEKASKPKTLFSPPSHPRPPFCTTLTDEVWRYLLFCLLCITPVPAHIDCPPINPARQPGSRAQRWQLTQHEPTQPSLGLADSRPTPQETELSEADAGPHFPQSGGSLACPEKDKSSS